MTQDPKAKGAGIKPGTLTLYRGGRRPGAGRKPLSPDAKRQPVTLKLPGHERAMLFRAAHRLGLSRGELVGVLLRLFDTKEPGH